MDRVQERVRERDKEGEEVLRERERERERERWEVTLKLGCRGLQCLSRAIGFPGMFNLHT